MKKKIKPVTVKAIPDERFSLVEEKKPTMRGIKIFERDYAILAEMDRVHIDG